MLIYAGIDEAGYGPMLGPLCVAASAFVVRDHDPAEGAPDLWRRLKAAVCREKSDRRQRIAVDDSKKLKGPNDGKAHPLRHLERGVLSFLGALQTESNTAGLSRLPATDADLLSRLGVVSTSEPWYGSETQLPVCHCADSLRIAASRLFRTLEGAAVSCDAMLVEVIDVSEFNQLVERTRNKASVNMAAALRLVEQLWSRWPHHHPRIILDRHGGRTRYREELQRAWPDAQLQIIAEDEARSRYRLTRRDAKLTVTFAREAESSHLPAALASMTAKYVRELMMARLNRYFRHHLPDLKPTAGYVQDARRYLKDIEPLMRELKLDPQALVRCV